MRFSLAQEYSNLIRLGLPVLVTQLGIIVVTFADVMMVGAYGVDELAAAAFVNSIFVLVTVMLIGLASGLTPLVGALFGKGAHREAGHVFRAGLQVNLLTALALTFVMSGLYFFLDCFGQPEELLPLIRHYYLIILGSLLPMSAFNCVQQTCNGINDTATPMWIILGCNVLNIIGNYLLIFGKFGCPELGLAGAGISTLFSRVAGAVAILCIFFKVKKFHPYAVGYHEARSLGALRRKVWLTSFPIMLQSGVECSLWTFGAVVSGWFGKIQLAAYQVVNTMAQLGFMTFISFSTATSIRVANYTGAGDMTIVRRVTAAGLHLCLILATIASLIFIIGGRHLLHLFTPDQAVINSAAALILPLVIYQYMDAMQLTYINALRGTAHVNPLLLIALVSYVVVGVPVLLLLADFLGLGNVGVYYSFDVALLFAAAMATVIFYRVVRKEAAK